MDNISDRRENRIQLVWLVGLWAIAFVPQWLFWSHGWNGVGAIMALAGVPLAAVVFGIGLGTRDRHLVIAGIGIGVLSAAVMTGVDEHLRARVTWLANKDRYQHLVSGITANADVTTPLVFEVDRSDSRTRVAIYEGVGPCCEGKAIVYDPTGKVMAANASGLPITPFENRVVYASQISGPWYYCVLM